MQNLRQLSIILGILIVLFIMVNASFVVDETQQVVITRFGEIRGEPITEPGLYFLVPFIDEANRLDKRFLEWDGRPEEVSTLEKSNIIINTYARWRISDPVLYFQRIRAENVAQSRLGEILNDESKTAIAKHRLVELVRTSNREIIPPEDLPLDEEVAFPEIEVGRDKITQEIIERAAMKAKELGIELLDLRFKRIKYVESVQQKIFERMTTERRRIADKFRSEGQGEASKILGDKERDLKEIQSDAFRQAEEIRGKADAEATAIYAGAYNRNDDTRDFYRFLKTMESYEETLSDKDVLMLSTDSEFYKFLEGQRGR
ncbi:MAG TPA: protease modulator HflC [Calditrichia bacterium]|nr:protease modulator HflC [Calditrichota bacterium]HQV32178.1 protease modulator HflC [Calditrichia bacterium]